MPTLLRRQNPNKELDEKRVSQRKATRGQGFAASEGLSLHFKGFREALSSRKFVSIFNTIICIQNILRIPNGLVDLGFWDTLHFAHGPGFNLWLGNWDPASPHNIVKEEEEEEGII